MILYWREGVFRESIEVFGSADRIRFEAGRASAIRKTIYLNQYSGKNA